MSKAKGKAKPEIKDPVQNLGLVGKKVGMAQIFDEEGNTVPVTVIEICENVVTAVMTKEKNGYDAVQVGNIAAKDKHMTKATAGHLKKNGAPLLRNLQEYRLHENMEIKAGDKLDATKFFEGVEKLDITGVTIGKGFQGSVKLHNHSDGRKTHGSKSHRQIGSIGAGTTPGRVYKGKTMPSMMGNEKMTIRKVKFISFNAENNSLIVRGPVPGKPGALLTIKTNGLRTWNAYNKVQEATAA